MFKLSENIIFLKSNKFLIILSEYSNRIFYFKKKHKLGLKF